MLWYLTLLFTFHHLTAQLEVTSLRVILWEQATGKGQSATFRGEVGSAEVSCHIHTSYTSIPDTGSSQPHKL